MEAEYDPFPVTQHSPTLIHSMEVQYDPFPMIQFIPMLG